MLVILIEIRNVSGAVVAIRNDPGEGDVGVAVVGHLEVADMIVLGNCIATKRKGTGCLPTVDFFLLLLCK